jgi:hypothetical protein
MMNNTEPQLPRLTPVQRQAVLWQQLHRGLITTREFEQGLALIKLEAER